MIGRVLLKGFAVASSLGFLAFAAVATVPAPPAPASKSPLLLTPEELAQAATQPGSTERRHVVRVRAIQCTDEEGCVCGNNQWVWSDGTPPNAEELTRMGGSVNGPE
jgi:hypothetical protein